MLCDALLKLKQPPKTFVCASAIGIYGDRGDEILDEKSPPGEAFLVEVCREWEKETEPLRPLGIRVVNLRFGMILSPAGGTWPKCCCPSSWVWVESSAVDGSLEWGRDRRCGGHLHALTHEELHGPVNAVSPNPMTNREFTKTLGHVLRRPTVFPLPGFLARLALGQMADELLLASSRRAAASRRDRLRLPLPATRARA